MDIKNYEIILHIGLHKTATKTLQRQFFPKCNDLNYLSTQTDPVLKVCNYTISTDPVYFNPAYCHDLLEPFLRDSKPNLISFESFSGPPWTGVHYGIDYRTPILHNLKAAFPNSKIIIALRRQDTLSKSLYRQYIQSGGTHTVAHFLNGNIGSRFQTFPILPANRFLFSPYLAEIERLFKSKILIMIFEQFMEDNNKYLEKMAKFIGIQHKPIVLMKSNATKLGPTAMEISRILNRVLPFRTALKNDALFQGIPWWKKGRNLVWYSPNGIIHNRWPKMGKISKERENKYYKDCLKVLEKCQKDNKRLDELYGLGIQNFGYY